MKVFAILPLTFALCTAGKASLWKSAADPIDLTNYVNRDAISADRFSDPEFLKAAQSFEEKESSFVFKRGTVNPDPNCGKENLGRIVGGDETKPNQFPWLVAVFCTSGGWFCTGSLIDKDYVLTAAHCVVGCSKFRIVAGAHNLHANEPNRQEIISTKARAHEDYDPTRLRNDLAIITLPESANIDSDIISTACLPSQDDESDHVGQEVVVTGWGKLSDSSTSIASALHYNKVNVIPNLECNLIYGIITSGHLCTSSAGGNGVCNGDSGGPLNLYDQGMDKFEQIGITSFVSSAGCESGYPHGFTRVSAYLDWIETHTGIRFTK